MGFIDSAGDSGNTTLLSGKTIRKDHPVLEALGVCEGLIARLGVAKLHNDRFKATISRFQKSLTVVAAVVSGEFKSAYPEISKESHLLDVLVEEYKSDLDDDIDISIIAGENMQSAELLIARAACREFERRLVTLQDSMEVSKKILKYINRLSDVILLMAIFTAKDKDFEID